MSSHPLREKNGWDQSIHFASHFQTLQQVVRVLLLVMFCVSTYPLRVQPPLSPTLPTLASQVCPPRHVSAGDEIRIITSVFTDMVRFRCTVPARAEADASDDGPVFCIGEADMALLNDYGRLDAFTAAVERILSGRELELPSAVVALELSSGVSSVLFGLQLSREQLGDQAPAWLQRLSCTRLVTSSDADAASVLAAIAANSRIPSDRLQICRHGVLGLAAAAASSPTASASPVSLIVCDLVEPCGLLSQGVLKDLRFATEFLSHRHVAVLPSEVTLVLAAVECEQLADQHRVFLDNTLADVGTVNSFGAVLLRELDLHRIPGLRFLSPQVDAKTLCLQGGVSSLPCACLVQLPLKKGLVHAVAFWFRMAMGAATALGPLSTDQKEGHWRQAAFLLDQPFSIGEDEDELHPAPVLEVLVCVDETTGKAVKITCLSERYGWL